MTMLTQNMIVPVLFSVRQTADRLGVSTKTIRRWIASGELPHYRIGRSIRIAEFDLIGFIRVRRAM
jgi:excisionase family DNA binding protein